MQSEQEIPRLFVEQYVNLVNDIVIVVMADKRTFTLSYYNKLCYLYGVEKIVQTYSLNVNDVMIFSYVALSTFEVSVYKSNGGMDLFFKGRNFHVSNQLSNGADPEEHDELNSEHTLIHRYYEFFS